MNYHLAIDIGASTGRHVIGFLDNDRLILKELYRFQNGFHEHEEQLIWPLSYLWEQILIGLKKCAEANMIPNTIGIDTWGVDFVLLDENGELVFPCVAYRDHRTDGMDDVLKDLISEKDLYQKTGIQKQIFNTIYQLLFLQNNKPHELSRATHFLMVPDYFNYLLTGKMANEYTNATTTSLVNVSSGLWDEELIKLLGLSPDIFSQIIQPGQTLAQLHPVLADEIGF
ncbi:MAG: FGGY family carbohydrate kinase, partial [Gallicola sp.]|nr:FGGY family carbohydrate kinase [Gallicola sp.]